MGLHTKTYWAISCDLPTGCESSPGVAWRHAHIAEEVAIETGWKKIGDLWLCYRHWTINEEDEVVIFAPVAQSGSEQEVSTL